MGLGVIKSKKFILLILVLIVAGVAGYSFLMAPLEDVEHIIEETEIVSERIAVTHPQDESAPAVPKKPEKVAKRKPVKATPAKTAPVTAPVKKTEAPKAAVKKPSSGDRSWVVNLASFRSSREAELLKESVVSGGHNTYTTQFTKDGVQWHRVRVGFYSSRGEATEVANELSREFNTPGAWVAKASKGETSRYSK